jgi:hypothetical protein
LLEQRYASAAGHGSSSGCYGEKEEVLGISL